MSMIKSELRRAFKKNYFFIFALLVGAVLASLSAWRSYQMHINVVASAPQAMLLEDPGLSLDTIYNFWIVIGSNSFFSGIFFLIWPLLSSISYSWSLVEDFKCGMSLQYMSRTKYKTYLTSKLITIFVLGGSSVYIPVLINLIECACFAPATPLFASDLIYHGVPYTFPFAFFLFNHPLIFATAWSICIFVIAGLYAMLIGLASLWARSYLKIGILGYLLLHVILLLGTKMVELLQTRVGFEAKWPYVLMIDYFNVIAISRYPNPQIHILIVISLLIAGIAIFLRLLKKESLWIL